MEFAIILKDSEHGHYSKEYVMVEPTHGWLKCQRADGLWDLYCMKNKTQMAEAAKEIEVLDEGHILIRYEDGQENEISKGKAA